MDKIKIKVVVEALTPKQRKRLATLRGVSQDRLASSYKGDWVVLLKDMTNAELARAMRKLLEGDELRIVALRAFSGHKTELDDIEWKADGTAPRRRKAKEIARTLCRGSSGVGEASWKKEIAPRLRDIGVESLGVPKGGGELVQLRRIF